MDYDYLMGYSFVMQTVLENVTAHDVRNEPFPHIVIENAVESALADQLIREYPSPSVLTKGEDLGSNVRFNFSPKDVKESPHVSQLWKSFIEAHTTKRFFTQFVSVFRAHLLELHPNFQSWWENPKHVRTGVNTIDNFDSHDVLMSAFIAGNTPVTDDVPSSVKIAHLDNLNKFYAGLFYLRSPEDDSDGGDLELYRYKGDTFKFHGQRLVDKRWVDAVATVPYQPNTLVLLPNSLHSLHGVTARNKTPHVRKFMNLVSEIEKPLLDLSPYKENALDRFRRRALNF